MNPTVEDRRTEEQMTKQDLLKKYFHYDCESGLLTRRITTSGNAKAGDVAGYITSGGYALTRFDGKDVQVHRLAWLYVYGYMPAKSIDHIDGNRRNNRIANLREATQSGNQQNLRKARCDSATGLLGASPHACGRFQASIRIGGKYVYLGLFKTAQEAHQAYLHAKRKHHAFCTI